MGKVPTRSGRSEAAFGPIRRRLSAAIAGIAASLMLAAALALSGVAAPAFAADFSVYPVSPPFAGRPTTSFTVSNHGARSLRVQVRTFRWTQSEGRDAHAPTEELIASPPFVELGPRENQIVRLLYRGGTPADAERAFHVVVSELPEPADGSPRRTRTLGTAVSFSMPVFVDAAQPGVSALSLDLLRAGRPEAMLAISNAGTRHARITALSLHGSGWAAPMTVDLPRTVLAGGSVALPLPPAALRQLGAGALSARIESDGQTHDVPLRLR